MGMMATTLMIVLTFGLSQPILRVCRLVPTTSPWATSPLEAVHGADRPNAPPAGPVVLIVPVPIRRADTWDSVPWASRKYHRPQKWASGGPGCRSSLPSLAWTPSKWRPAGHGACSSRDAEAWPYRFLKCPLPTHSRKGKMGRH